MRRINKIVSALKDRSGASLIFVLGVMLMLLAVGASVLAAAFGNFGIGIRQENHNRAMLLGDSIHRNIKYSLTGVSDDKFNAYLAGQIARQIYDSGGDMDDILLDVAIHDSLSSDIAIPKHEVTLSFPYTSVTEIPFIAGVPELCEDPADPNNCAFCPIPRTARLRATMIVTVKVEVDRSGDEGRFITFEAVYAYRGGVLTEDPLDSNNMVFDDQGTWSIESFEIIER